MCPDRFAAAVTRLTTRRRATAVLVCAAAFTPLAPVPVAGAAASQARILAAAGTFPDAVVDDAGTAHIVWNENRGDAADVVVYCRLKRTAKACDTTAQLSWVKAYGTGDDPKFNIGSAPKIVVVAGRLVVFSHRYPTSGEKPDGASSSTVVAWSSADGGTTWTPNPAVVGRSIIDQLITIGNPANPTVLAFGVDPLCQAPGPASACVAALSPTAYNGTAGNLTTGRDQNYYASITVDERGLPVTSVEDLNYDTFVRRWTGVGSVQDPSTWTAPSVFGADQSGIAGGPAGVYLMAKPKAGFGAYVVRRLNAGAGGGYTAGAGPAISPAADNVLGRLHQDESGRLIAVWQQRNVGVQLRTTDCRAAATPTFLRGGTLAAGGDNGQFSIGAAVDGGGVVAFNRSGGINGEGQIAVAPFGSRALTGAPGLGNLAGGGVKQGLSLADPQRGPTVRGTVTGVPACATVRVDVLNAAGRLPAYGTATIRPAAGQTASFAIRLNFRGRLALTRAGRITVTVRLTMTVAGKAAVTTERIVLRRR